MEPSLGAKYFLVGIYVYYVVICGCLLLSQVSADNIAFRKPTKQHGTWGGYDSGRAVDGDTNQNLDDGSCAHPDGLDGNLNIGRGRATWWYVDLSNNDPSKMYRIENITIWFRVCCEERIRGIEVYVGSPSHSQTRCADITEDDYVQTIFCSTSFPVTYLNISHPSQASLGLCEVIVNGYEHITQACNPGAFGPACTDCNCFDQNELCDSATGACPISGCAAGYKDTDCQALCQTFLFGRGCSNDCHCKNFGQTCNPVDGSCPRGECEEGYYGFNCSLSLPTIHNRLIMVPGALGYTDVQIDIPASVPRANRYVLEYKINSLLEDYATGITVSDSGQNYQRATQSNLLPGTTYALRAVPYLGTLRGGESDPLYVTTKELPASGSVPSPTKVEETSVTLQFQTPDPFYDTFWVEYRTYGSGHDYTRGVRVSIEPFQTQMATQTELQPGTEYELRIIPVQSSANLEGPPSPSVRINTLVTPSPTPSPTTTPAPTPSPPTPSPPTPSPTLAVPLPSSPATPSATPTTTGEPGGTEGPVIAGGGGGNGGMIAAIIVVLLLVIIIVIAFVIYKRRGGKISKTSLFGKMKHDKLKHDKLGDEEPTERENVHEVPNDDVRLVVDPPPSSGITPLPPAGSEPPTPNPSLPPTPDPERKPIVSSMPLIRIDDLAAHIRAMKKKPDAYKEEFKKLPIGPTSKWEVGNKQENRNKNRFLNIRAYDHSRVVLEASPDDLHSDYINADFLSGYGGEEKVYIAAQGPKKGTVDDTWRMVWQTGTNRIVMVTNLVEGGRIKCEQYWPNKGTEQYGDIKVTLVSTDNYAAYLIRIFNVEYGEDSRTVRQFHFTSWPDHGVPTVATELLEFRRRVKSYDKEATGPLLIHCSAGVGRTGTYIAVDYCLLQAKDEGEVSVYNITYLMRKQRVNMIQTLDQYIFVYDAILEALVSGETIISASDFREDYRRLCVEDPETNKTKLGAQFETLETLKTPAQDTKPLVALESENKDKNRYKDIVPSNRYRPFLSSIVDGTTSYVNAVYVDGFREKLAYLVTQMPMPHTVVDMWRLLHDHHSSTVVMLNALDKNDKTSAVYWPESTEQPLNFGPLEITMTNVDTENPHITIRDFKITSTKSRRTPTVRQFQLNSWPKDEEYPESRRSLLELISLIEKWQQQTGNGPVTIHCMTGAARCGLFVSTMYATEQLKVDQAVDVFGAVKQVRIPRPQFISDIDQYKFVHEMVMEYMSGFGDYSNFS